MNSHFSSPLTAVLLAAHRTVTLLFKECVCAVRVYEQRCVWGGVFEFVPSFASPFISILAFCSLSFAQLCECCCVCTEGGRGYCTHRVLCVCKLESSLCLRGPCSLPL